MDFYPFVCGSIRHSSRALKRVWERKTQDRSASGGHPRGSAGRRADERASPPASSPTIRQEQVNSLTFQTSTAQRCVHFLGYLHETGGRKVIQFSELGNMAVRHYQHVPWIDRVNVHESHTQIILMDEAGRSEAGDDVAKNARH